MNAENPHAEEITPSIPFTPLFEVTTRYGQEHFSSPTEPKEEKSRTGIEEERKKDPLNFASVWAINGSLNSDISERAAV